MFRAVGQRPVLAVLVGAVAIAFSGILFRLSHVSSSTGAFFRCLFALPPLFLLARMEDRRYGQRERRSILLAWIAGAFFAADLILWHNAIEPVGAGLATLLGNIHPLYTATLSSAIFCALIGLIVGDLDLTPSLAATGWLILYALSSQALGWLLISSSLPRLPAVVTSILLTLQPVCSVVFAALILDESPSALQLAGAGCILAGLIIATIGRRPVPAPEPELAG